MDKETSIWKRLLVIGMIVGMLSSSLIGVYFGFKGMRESERIEQEQAQIEKIESEIGLDEDVDTNESVDEVLEGELEDELESDHDEESSDE